MNAEAQELVLFIDNNEPLYKQKVAIFKALAKKKDRGVFQSKLAPKAFASLTNAAAKRYVTEHGSPADRWNAIFDPIARRHAALTLADHFEGWYSVDYQVIKAETAPKKKAKGDGKHYFRDTALPRNIAELLVSEYGMSASAAEKLVSKHKRYIRKAHAASDSAPVIAGTVVKLRGGPEHPKTLHLYTVTVPSIGPNGRDIMATSPEDAVKRLKRKGMKIVGFYRVSKT